MAAVHEQMLTRIAAQGKQIAEQAQAIKFKDVKIERITFELARLKAHRFGAKTERMKQRQMLEEALAEDQASLEAHTLLSRFVDHIPYYRQEEINARSGVHTPRSTLASWSGAGGAELQPLYDVHREFVLGTRIVQADETPVNMLDPGAGKTKRAYMWAYSSNESR